MTPSLAHTTHHNYDYINSLAANILDYRSSHCFFLHGNMPPIDGRCFYNYCHYVEANNYSELAPDLAFINEEHPSLSLCISTKTAFEKPAADLFVQLLKKQFWIADTMADAMLTCLQEGVMNAIVHGNLNIHHQSNILDNFEQYYNTISHALHHSAGAHKRISIFAWRKNEGFVIAVSDQGHGFTVAPTAPVLTTQHHGRGIMLIHSFADYVWQTTPNNIFMEFTNDKHTF